MALSEVELHKCGLASTTTKAPFSPLCETAVRRPWDQIKVQGRSLLAPDFE